MSAHQTPRTSDRLLTPAVVIVALVIGGGAVMLTIAAVAWLTAQGRDPGPMLELVAQVTGAVGILINLMLSIGARSGVAKVERTTGLDLTNKLTELDAKVDRALWVDVGQALPPVPPPVTNRLTAPHPFATRTGGGPGGDGE